MHIVDVDQDCTPAMFDMVGRFSLEVVTADMACRSSYRCLDGVAVDSVGTLEAALRSTAERTGEVLIELPDSLTGFLSITGRALASCAPDPSIPNPTVLCGAVDIAGASSGDLTIELGASGCAEPVKDPCP